MVKIAATLLFVIPLSAQVPVEVAPYYTPGAGTQNLTSNASTDTSLDMLASGSMARTLIPFSGLVYQIGVYLGDTSNLNDIYFSKNTCTTNAASRCTVFTTTYTAEITGPFTSNAVNTFTLAAPLPVLKWDALGIRVEWSTPHAANVAVLSAQLIGVNSQGDATQPEACYSQLNVSKSATLTLASMTLIPNAGCIPIGAYMIPPQVVGIGDSIISSAPLPSDSVADAFALNYPIPANYSPTYFWVDNFPVPLIYENLGWGGQTSVQIQARFAAALALNPAWILIDGGINDINGGCASTGCTGPQIAAIETALDSMMAAAQTAGVKAFILLCGPDSSSFSGSNARMTGEDSVNANTIAVAPGYGATVVDWRCTLGQFRSGQRAGNCWDWQSAYLYGDGLGVHPNQAGVQLIGNLIYSLLPYRAASSRSSSGLSGASGWSGGVF